MGSHDHGGFRSLRLGSSRLERSVWWAVGVCAALTLVGLIVLWPSGSVKRAAGDIEPQAAPVSAVVDTVGRDLCDEADPESGQCQFLSVRITSGSFDGEQALIQLPGGAGTTRFDDGDRIMVETFVDAEGQLQVSFIDFKRSSSLLVLLGLFVVVVLALGRLRGLGALGGLAASLLVLTVFVLPSILRGHDAVLVALVGSSVIAFLALFLAHGLNVGTAIALIGTFASMAIIGVLAAIFSGVSRLTGLADEYATVLPAFGIEVNLKGMLLAGIVIGSLGVLDDVTVTQVSAVAELRAAQPDATPGQVYRQALNIGRDHIASTVNTLFLAYAGAALPLLLLFTQSQQPITSIVSRELVATEVIRSLVGSIGLVASVPITTLLASRVMVQPQRVDK